MGTIVDQYVEGTASINSDCTETIVYDQRINGQPTGTLTVTFQVLYDGKEIRGMITDPGGTATCNLRLLNR